MKNVFVVGGCGFIGSHLLRRLLVTPGVERVRVYDNLSSGRIDNLPRDARVTFSQASARDFSALNPTMRDFAPDTVFHLAANPDIARAVTEPTIDFDQGTVLTKNVLEAMRLNGVKRMIYFSGSGVYGYWGDFPLPESYGPMRPISTYGASKLASEALICAYCHMFDLTARAFRFANVVGPRQTHGVGYDFLRKLKADPTKLAILGDGTQSKSYVYISDVLDAVFIATEKMDVGYDVFNVGTDDAVDVASIAEMSCAAMGLSPGSVRFEFTGGTRGWKGDVPRVRMNYDAIRALGWKPQHTTVSAIGLALGAMALELNESV